MAGRRSRSVSRKRSKSMCRTCGNKKRNNKRSSKKMSCGGKKVNAFFKKMLSAKKAKKASFNYNGKKYVGKTHPLLGMIYKSA